MGLFLFFFLLLLITQRTTSCGSMAARNFGHAGASKRPLEHLKTHLCSPHKTLCRCIINSYVPSMVLFWSTLHPESPSEMRSFPISSKLSTSWAVKVLLSGFGALPPWCGHARCECVTALPADLFITCEYCHYLTKAIWNECFCGTSFIT